MNLTAHQLRTFSRCLMTLSDRVPTLEPDRWLTQAVSALETLVPFDSAWWGQVEADRPGGPAKNVMHGSLGLSPRFAEEWNAIARCDVFARTSMERLGEPIIHNGSDEVMAREPESISDFCHRHGLFHCMAITLRFPSSGLLFFISIYRDRDQPGFTDMDAVWLEEYSSHLLNGWVRCLHRANRGRFRDHWDSVALANSTGRVLYIGKQLSRVLDERFDGWQGTFLPDPLMATLATPRRAPLKRHRTGLMVQPCGQLASLRLSEPEESHLSPRELSAAQLYAQGQSYKEVARALGVTPATVRTYLRQVYGQLGVRNKVELVGALRNTGVDISIEPSIPS